ncbi:hypothetical protein D3C76_248220 [compost metagenome]
MANEQRPQDPSRQKDPGMRPDSPDKGGQGSGRTGGAGQQPGQQPGKPGQTGGGNRPQDWEDPMKNRDTNINKDNPDRR